MIYIAHRGNLAGPNPEKENHPEYIDKAVQQGFYVEVDVRLVDDKIMLGHDEPQYEVDYSFLNRHKIWCHAKNPEALQLLRQKNLAHYFWHDKDDYTITSRGYIWMYPEKKILGNSHLIYVLPEKQFNAKELSKEDKIELRKCFGLCSDYVEEYYRGLHVKPVFRNGKPHPEFYD